MAKVLEVFRGWLQAALDSNQISKAELHRKTGIARPSIDAYLEGSDIGLKALQRVADAIGLEPWEVLRPHDNQKGPRSPLIAEIVRRLERLDERQIRALLGMVIAFDEADKVNVGENKKLSNK
jgi:transcriptional regulator with XRE-family HTH domain